MTPPDRYGAPSLECDLVMKGGITSGVVYPLAICRLAERYRLRNVGGASAGAIAAVTAGAAEYARATGSVRAGSGYAGLEALPAKLTEDVAGSSRLLSLFQPTDATRSVFGIVLVAIGKSAPWRKVVLIAGAVLGARPTGVLLGLAAAVAVLALGGAGLPRAVAAAAGALALLVLGLLVSVAQFVWGSLSALGTGSRYGMCPGYSKGAPASEPPLTQWLTDVIADLAGVPRADPPITFGELAKHDIKLSLMTTDVTRGRPYRLPFGESDQPSFFFKKSDFDDLFPEAVVGRMVAGARARLERPDGQRLRDVHAKVNAAGGDYLPFPDVDELPLVVGARMSLSFPVLLQAVPLYAVDWTLRANQDGSPELERCWFSDGGIRSNLPIHFFDALLPGRPTFALSLKEEHPDYPVQVPPFAAGRSERDNVWIPTNNTAGTAASWNRFDAGQPTLPLFSFLAAMVDTMQCWNDNLTIRHPGYRDRVVHISHMKTEGGLNLNMPKEIIDRLSNRGAAAGEALGQRFDPATGTGWPNHLWVRYRTLLAMLSDQAGSLVNALDPGRGGLLTQLTAAPPSYKFDHDARAAAARSTDALVQLASELATAAPPLSDGAPNPRADLRGRPRST